MVPNRVTFYSLGGRNRFNQLSSEHVGNFILPAISAHKLRPMHNPMRRRHTSYLTRDGVWMAFSLVPRMSFGILVNLAGLLYVCMNMCLQTKVHGMFCQSYVKANTFTRVIVAVDPSNKYAKLFKTQDSRLRAVCVQMIYIDVRRSDHKVMVVEIWPKPKNIKKQIIHWN